MIPRIGVDENGLGPRLGPMIVTAVLADVSEAGARVMGRRPRGKLAERLGDSKGLVAHGDIALGEAWARAIAARAGLPASSPDALLHALLADPKSVLRAPCPSHVEAQCWSAEGEAFVAEPSLVATLALDLARLADKGIDVRLARSLLFCTRRLNDAARAGQSRFVVDLHAMERLVLELREVAGRDVVAVCGKVGGIGKYADFFGPLGGRLHVTTEEVRRRSAYHFPTVGELAFVQDADAQDLLVGMASLVGKWIREVAMARIVRHYRVAQPELPDASGYHDPVTERFVAATALARKKQRVDDDCFERVKMGAA